MQSTPITWRQLGLLCAGANIFWPVYALLRGLTLRPFEYLIAGLSLLCAIGLLRISYREFLESQSDPNRTDVP